MFQVKRLSLGNECMKKKDTFSFTSFLSLLSLVLRASLVDRINGSLLWWLGSPKAGVLSPSTFSVTDPFPRVVKTMMKKLQRNYYGSPEATFQWHSLDLYGTGRESKYVLIGMSLSEKYRCLLHFSWWDIRENTWWKSRKEHRRREVLMRRGNSV